MTRPTCIIVSGPPGSGKSTIATRLSQHLGLPHCARDTIKQGQMWHVAHARPPHDAHQACNHAFRETVTLLLHHGVSHVCDAAFQHHVWQPFLAHWQPLAHIKIIVCTVDDTVRHQRLRQRLHAEPQRGTYMPMMRISPILRTNPRSKYSTPTIQRSWLIHKPLHTHHR